MKIQSAVLAMAMAFGMLSGACSSQSLGTSSETGGSSTAKSGGASGSGGVVGTGGVVNSGGTVASGGIVASGGVVANGGAVSKGGAMGAGGTSGNGGGTGSCTNVQACGGQVVGTWTVASSCIKVSGQLDLSLLGIGCKSAAITGSLQVSGSWTAKSNGTYTDNTTTSGTEQIALDSACLSVSGTTTTCDRLAGVVTALGYASVNCTSSASNGCDCTATIDQQGGIGAVSNSASASGSYTTSGTTMTTDGSAQYSYCVSGNTLTLTPQVSSPTITGSIVLQNGSSPGSGGTTGAGGAAGAGGRTGAGGTTGAGGRTGSGGATSAGGVTGAGGVTAPGGTTGAGGKTGAGGATGSGGATSAGGMTGAGGAAGAGGSPPSGTGPCDIYAAASPATPCVAAYSTVRILNSKYTGPLYQVRAGGNKTGSGGTLKDIGTIAGGFADGAAQDAACSGATSCTISILYDQSGKGNNLKVAPAGCYTGTASEADYESDATKRSLTVSGHKVYALYMNAHEGYRNNSASGMPTGTAAQGIYEVADGKRIGSACCWDFGNASTNNCYGPTGSMNAIFFGTGYWGSGAGNGPWFMGDFEAGVWAGGSGSSNTKNNNLPSSNMDYAFGILKTDSSGYAIRVGNAASGTLTNAYDGAAPATWQMHGGIILGIGGDNSNSSQGTFFEGVVTAGRPADPTEDAVLQNVQAAGYGQ